MRSAIYKYDLPSTLTDVVEVTYQVRCLGPGGAIEILVFHVFEVPC